MSRAVRISRWRYRRERRRRRGGRASARVMLVMFGVFLALGVVGLLFGTLGVTAVYAYFTQELPDFTEIERLGQDEAATFETTKIYAWGDDPDGDGVRDLVLIYEVIDPLGGDRQWLPLAAMPPELVNATVAIEDRTFWTNQGFDLQGIARAFNATVLRGEAVQGGSSITQQLVKNNLIEPERRIVGAEVGLDDYRRKAEEVLLAQRMSREYTKEQVLEWYLNTNFYGNLAYGVEAAARVYFDKSAAELTLAEAAMLAAIPQSPALNPIDNPEAAKSRQELVLDAMAREGYIDAETLIEAKYTALNVVPGIEQRFDIIAPHFALYVRKQLEERFGPERVLRGGLQVYTSLDLTLQAQAECVSRFHVARLNGGVADPAVDQLAACPALTHLPPLPAADLGVNRQVNNAAVVMLDPTTGEIRALVGSLDYWDPDIDGAFNVAVDGRRQPGSSFKPFTYLTALSQGYTAATMVLDVETDFGTPYNGVAYVPQNYDRRFHGPMRLRQALGSSYNVPAVEVMSWVGVDSVIRTAHSMGITTLDGGPNAYGLALTLGGGEVTLLDMVYAYAVLDNMGTMIGQPRPEVEQRLGYRTLDPVAILRIEDRNGQRLYEYNQPETRDILPPALAYLMNDMLSDPGARCGGFGCPNVLELSGSRPAAVKTGTTDDYRDAWTIGYTPRWVTGVWIGNTDNAPMVEVPGSRGAAPIWRALMEWALAGEPVQVWQRPSGINERTVCAISGLLPTPHCPTVSEIFIAGTEPTVFDTIFQEFRVNRETGRLATIYTPPELIESRIYRVYPERAADWVRENEIETPPQEYDTIDVGEAAAGDLAITSPRPFQFVRGPVEIIGNAQGEDFAYYRLAYFEGLDPLNVQVLADNVTEPKENRVLGVIDVSQLSGLHTFLLTLVRQDGSFEEIGVHVIVDNSPPTAELAFPLPDQSFSLDDEWIVVQALVEDDLSVERVEFFVDGAEVPFAISTVPPYTEKWTIPGPGCHTFHIIATDAAQNKVQTAPVRACVISGEGGG